MVRLLRLRLLKEARHVSEPFEAYRGDPELDFDPSCPGCRCEGRFRVTMRKGMYQYRRCGRCGFFYAFPRPSILGLVRRLSSFAPMAPPLSPHQQEKSLQELMPRVNWIQQQLPHAKSLLDIGAGNGAFVAAAKRAGFDATGTELVPGSGRFPGIQILVGDLGELDLLPRSFDVITLWDTIEHVLDPVGVTRRCLELLRADGLLVIQTPNQAGFSARLRGAGWWAFGPSDHVQVFRPRALFGLIARAGGCVATARTQELCPWDPPGGPQNPAWPVRAFTALRESPRFQSALVRYRLGDWILLTAGPC